MENICENMLKATDVSQFEGVKLLDRVWNDNRYQVDLFAVISLSLSLNAVILCHSLLAVHSIQQCLIC